MNSYSFLSSGDKQDYNLTVFLNTKDAANLQEYIAEIQSHEAEEDLRSLALIRAKQGNYPEAIALFDRLIALSPHNAIDYNNRGLVYFQSGDIHKAITDYNKALSLNSNLSSAYNNRANYYAACEMLSVALADYDIALDLNPRYVKAWINRAITLRDMEEYLEAIDNLETALLFGDLEAEIIAQRGRTFHLWGDWNFAIADYRRALFELSLPNSKTNNPCLQTQVESWLQDLVCYPN
ncbi:MAG: tetratricopeptide repeat protein [Cyanobacteria bacterium P01_A01_bin.84]